MENAYKILFTPDCELSVEERKIIATCTVTCNNINEDFTLDIEAICNLTDFYFIDTRNRTITFR